MFLRAAVSSHAAARVLLIHSLLLAAPSWGESSCQTASGSSCWGSAIPGGDAVFGGEGRGALRLRGGHAGCPPSGQGHMRSRQGDEAMRAATQTVADGDMAKALKQNYKAQMESAVQDRVLEVAQHIEEQTDRKMREMDDMSSDELEKIREKQISRMKKMASRTTKWKRQGHGSYNEIEERDFFQSAHKSSRIILHFYRPSTERCVLLDEHLRKLAEMHLETLFIKVNAEKSPFLATRLGVEVLPTMKLFKDGQVMHSMVGFDEFGGEDTFKTKQLRKALARHKIIRGEHDGDGLADAELSDVDGQDLDEDSSRD